MSDQRYPLAWPSGWKRAVYRKRANFSKRGYLNDELRRLNATHVVISTNLALNKGGSFRRDQRQPDDPGVACYFKVNGRPRCMASDLWTRIPDNMAAIAGTIEALRMVDRYGVGSIDQAFAGYTALQPAADVDWWIVLGVSALASNDQVDAAFKALAKKAHADAGGHVDDMARLNVAMGAFRQARGL